MKKRSMEKEPKPVKKIFQKLKPSFGLGELVITLGIIGLLMMILLPLLNKTKPDENELLRKKAYYILDRVVDEISTDEFLYPKNGDYTGFGNNSPVTVNGEVHSGNTKFCTLFASRINKAANSSVNCVNGEKSFTSAEGIDWYLPISDFKKDGYETITVDVNGVKLPNAYGKDQFSFKVRSGQKILSKEVEVLPDTVAPQARPVMPNAPDVDNSDSRTGQKWYSITCRVFGSGTVLGVGDRKPNGHYQLVAIPSIGYKGNWFTKNVTVKDADFTDCSVTFSSFNCNIPGACPQQDGSTITPTDPETPAEEKTYCINITMTGEKNQCAYAGNGCKKPSGKYVVSASAKSGYKTSWVQQNVTISDKDVDLTVECTKEDVPDKCYSITTSGDTANCPVTLPAGTCKTDKTKFIAGTYSYTVTPKNGYSFDGSTEAASKQILITNKDENVPITCSKGAKIPLTVNFTYGSVVSPYARMWTTMTLTEPGASASPRPLVLSINKDTKKISNVYELPSGTKYSFTGLKSHYIGYVVSTPEAETIFNNTKSFGPVYYGGKTYTESGKIEGILTAATVIDFSLDTSLVENTLGIVINYLRPQGPSTLTPVDAKCSGNVCEIPSDSGLRRFGVMEIKVSGHDEKNQSAEIVPWRSTPSGNGSWTGHLWNGPFVSGSMNYFLEGRDYKGSQDGVYMDIDGSVAQTTCVFYKDYPDIKSCISTKPVKKAIKCPGNIYHESTGLCIQKQDATYNPYSPVYAPCYQYKCRNYTPGPGAWNPPDGCYDTCNGYANMWATYEKSCSSLGSGWRLPTYNELLTLTVDSSIGMTSGTYWSSTWEDESPFTTGGSGESTRMMVVEWGETPMPYPKTQNAKARCVKTFNQYTDIGY